MKKKILLIHKKNCSYSFKLIRFLKKRLIKIKTSTSSENQEVLKILKKDNFDYIVLFRSHLILKKNIINLFKKSCINFHPSTPNYRGIGGINFAIYNNEIYFGSTSHFINEKIDDGKIINVFRFKINKKKELDELYDETLYFMFKQAKYVLTNLDKLPLLCDQSKKEKWSKILYKRNDLDKLYRIKPNIEKSKLKKIIKATKSQKFKPYIIFKGYKFNLES